MTSLRELNSQFDALGMTNIRVAMITRGEHKGKFAIVQIIPNGQPKELYKGNSLENCINFVKEKFKISKVNQKDVKDTRTANLWLKQNGFGNMMKVASELKGNRRVYTVYSLDPRVKNKELYKGTLNHCIDFIKSQTGIKDNVVFADLKSSMRRVDNKPVVNQPIQIQNNTQIKNTVSMIRNVDDANRWLQSIGADKKYKFIISPYSNEVRVGPIYSVESEFGTRVGCRSIYICVKVMSISLNKRMPACIDDRGEKVVNIDSANRWLQRIKYENEIKFVRVKDKFGLNKYAYMSVGNGKQEMSHPYSSLKLTIKNFCMNYCEFEPYM